MVKKERHSNYRKDPRPNYAVHFVLSFILVPITYIGNFNILVKNPDLLISILYLISVVAAIISNRYVVGKNGRKKQKKQ